VTRRQRLGGLFERSGMASERKPSRKGPERSRDMKEPFRSQGGRVSGRRTSKDKGSEQECLVCLRSSKEAGVVGEDGERGKWLRIGWEPSSGPPMETCVSASVTE